jgi:hypothetical protein
MQTVYVVLWAVKRTADAVAAAVQDMGVCNRGAHVLVAEQLLDGSDVVAGLEQVSPKRVPQG